MKTRLTLLAGAFALVATAQDKVAFKVVTLPNKKYTAVMSTSSVGNIDFKGSQEKIDELKARGVTIPIQVTGVTDMIISTKTGKVGPLKRFPATLLYESAKSKQNINGRESEKEEALSGLRMTGSYDLDGNVKIDSIISDKITDEMKQSIRTSIENIQQQITFPKTPMKVGDTFDQQVPMDIPMAGLPPIKISLQTKYTLRKIQSGIAAFDFSQVATLNNTDKQQIPVTASGKGTGTAEFNLLNSYITQYTSDLDLDLTAAIQELTMIAKIAIKVKQNVKIE